MLSGAEGLVRLILESSPDMVLNALVGSAGLGPTVATLGEGIEDQLQLRNLQDEDCDSGQGFLFARPLEPGAIDELLRLSAAVPAPAAT